MLRSRSSLLVYFFCACLLAHCYLFSDLSYDSITSQIDSLKLATSFAIINTAENLYKIPASKEGSFQCSPQIIRITERESLDSDRYRPQIFISGEIHGDERVGPVTSLVTAQLLVNSAGCVIEKNAGACDFLRKFSNLTDYQKKWLAFLATRRDSLIVPTANCLGYHLHRRDDAGVDPNRDFAYARRDHRCFLSSTAKVIYSLMKENIIQMVVTYHGGMVAIGYEWGSPNHNRPNDASPDHLAYSQIGKVLTAFGGKFQKEKAYPVGEINSVIYAVDGGMEDWLYAEGWDTNFLAKDCHGYASIPSYQRQFSPLRPARLRSRRLKEVPAGNRAMVFLVETSDLKHPSSLSLGGSEDILNPFAAANGHIPRNVRLSLSAIDLLQPYTCFERIEISSVATQLQLSLDWIVGGGITVDQTFLALHSFDPRHHPVLHSTRDFTRYLDSLGTSDEDLSVLASSAASATFPTRLGSVQLLSSVFKGKTRWSLATASSSSEEVLRSSEVFRAHAIPLQQILTQQLATHLIAPSKPLVFWIIAWSRVDGSYGSKGQGFPNHLPPQAHYSNLRTNSLWNCSLVGQDSPRGCQGRKYWPSDFLELRLDAEREQLHLMKEIVDCAWWDYSHRSERSPPSRTFPFPLSARSTLHSPNASSTSSSLVSGGEDKVPNSSFPSIAYRIYYQPEVSLFFSTEKLYFLVSLGLFFIVAVGRLLTSYWRRNRVYNTLLNNQFLSLPTGFQR